MTLIVDDGSEPHLGTPHASTLYRGPAEKGPSFFWNIGDSGSVKSSESGSLVRNFVRSSPSNMSSTSVKEKRKELSDLLKEQEDEEFLDLLLQILKDKDKKEVNTILKAIWGDEETSSAFYKVITEVGKAAEEEGIEGFSADGAPLEQGEIKARVKAASNRVKEGHYTTQEEMEKKGPRR